MGVAAKGTFKIIGRGKVQKWVEYKGEKIKIIFEDALHAPDLDHDLISIGSLIQKGVKLGIDETGTTLRVPDGRPFMKCPMLGTMFIVNFMAPPRLPTALTTQSLNHPADLKTWHWRLANMGENTINEMI